MQNAMRIAVETAKMKGIESGSVLARPLVREMLTGSEIFRT